MAVDSGRSAVTQTAGLLRFIAHAVSGRRLVVAVLCGVLGSAVLAIAGAEPMNSAVIGFPGGLVTFLLVTH
jgi:hypothetical protein